MRKQRSHIKRITPTSIDKEELDSFLFTEDDFEAHPIGSYVKILQTMAYSLPDKERDELLNKYYVGMKTPNEFVRYIMNRVQGEWGKDVSNNPDNIYHTYDDYSINGVIDTYQATRDAINNMINRMEGYSIERAREFISEDAFKGKPLCNIDGDKLTAKATDYANLNLYRSLDGGTNIMASEDTQVMLNGVQLNEVMLYFMKMYSTFIESDIYRSAKDVFDNNPGIMIDGSKIVLDRLNLQEDLDRYTDNIVWVLPDDQFTVGSATMGRIGIDPLYDGIEIRVMVLIPDNSTREDTEYILKRNLPDGVEYKIYTAQEYNISMDVFNL